MARELPEGVCWEAVEELLELAYLESLEPVRGRLQGLAGCLMPQSVLYDT